MGHRSQRWIVEETMEGQDDGSCGDGSEKPLAGVVTGRSVFRADEGTLEWKRWRRYQIGDRMVRWWSKRLLFKYFP